MKEIYEYKKSKYLGMKIKATNGQMMEVIKAYSYKDKPGMKLDIIFDDGTIVYGKQPVSFKLGNISNPNGIHGKVTKNQKHIGEENTNTCGFHMVLTEWRGTNDITVRFDDGNEVKSRYESFKKGQTSHPIYTHGIIEKLENKKKYEGQTKIVKNGMKVTVIEYISLSKLIVEFEDGVRTTCRLNMFKNGEIRHPSMTTAKMKAKNKFSKITYKSVCGLDIKIKEYNGYENITAQFEDGYEIKTNLRTLKGGKLKHPLIHLDKHIPYKYKTITYKYMNKYNEENYFACKCEKCNLEDILNTKELVFHECMI